MPEYTITWSTNAEAPDPRSAIEQALEHMGQVREVAPVFEVAEVGGKQRAMVIDLADEHDPTGHKVWDRDGQSFGIATGATRKCQLEGCPSIRIVTRWPGGRITMPCARGMDFGEDGYRIR